MKKIIKKLIIYTLIFCELFQGTVVYALTKEETVYTKLDETGKNKSISITEHLYDYEEKKIYDKTNLKDIKNINGSEKYKLDNNDLIWDAEGNDIYYKGTYKDKLPLSIDVKYYLNGKEKKVDDILGKKGNIKISFKYINNSYKIMNINGKTEKMYVPYAIITTTILNNKNNKNIKVTNGKVINNGVNSLIMAVSSPGLYESLKTNQLKDLSNVEISFDTDSFELNSIYMLATTNMFNDNKIDISNEINSIYQNINLLQSNMNNIVDASKKLSDGSNKMDIGVTELNNEVQQLIGKYQYYRNQDHEDLKEELIKIIEQNINIITPALEEEITNETSKIIKENKKELESAVIEYSKKNTKLVIEDEVNRLTNKLDIDSIIEKTINSNLYNLIKNDSEISNITNMLNEDINNELNIIINKEANEIINGVKANITDEERKAYINNISEKYDISYEKAEEIVTEVQTDTLNQVKNSLTNINISKRIIESLNNENYLSDLVNEYINKLNSKIYEVINSDTYKYSNSFKEKLLEALYKDLENSDFNKIDINRVIDEIVDNTANDLSSKYTEDYTNKVVQSVINKEFDKNNTDSKLRLILSKYEANINDKINVIDGKVNTLSDSLFKLNDGSKQISLGMNALSNGLDKYNKEGINKINELVNVDVKTMQSRIEILAKLSEENKTIDDISEGTKGNSKIIYMIDSKTKTKEVTIEKKSNNKKKNLWDKIKGLFN